MSIREAGVAKVIVAGTRTIDPHACMSILDDAFSEELPAEIVSGGAKGPDSAGEQWARANGVPVRRFAADWMAHGRAAGIRRNEEMAAYVGKGGALIAFWDGVSCGTADMIKRARAHGLRVTVIR